VVQRIPSSRSMATYRACSELMLTVIGSAEHSLGRGTANGAGWVNRWRARPLLAREGAREHLAGGTLGSLKEMAEEIRSRGRSRETALRLDGALSRHHEARSTYVRRREEPQAGPGGPRVQVRRRAGPGVPHGDRGARAREIRPELPARPARLSLSVRQEPPQIPADPSRSRRTGPQSPRQHRGLLVATEPSGGGREFRRGATIWSYPDM
jgi:hypothetical protein